MSDSAEEQTTTLSSYFRAVSREISDRGPIGEIVTKLATGDASAVSLSEIVGRHGVGQEEWFRNQIVDLFIDYVSKVVGSRESMLKHQGEIRTLKRVLSLAEGEIAARRPAEVSTLLRAQLREILEDSVIDNQEDLLQVELQAIFGLGYDDYLALVRPEVERAYMELINMRGQTPADRSKLEALLPLYRMATSPRRTRGAR